MRARTVFKPASFADTPFSVPDEKAVCDQCGQFKPVAVYANKFPFCADCVAGKTKRHKYGVSPPEQRTVDGILFDSAAEARRYGELKLLEKGGYIRQLELQPEFVFVLDGKPIFKYIADFRYFEGLSRVVEDCKGVRTPVYRLKKKLIEAQFNVRIVEVP